MEELIMAKGPKHRVPFRRRREGKTNYHRRLKIIKSGKLRLVIDCSKKHCTVQVVKTQIEGDKILVHANSQHLVKRFEWNFNTGNIPAAYLTGYYCGLLAKNEEIEEAILDVGLLVHNDRVKSAFKGFLESGIYVEHNEKWFSNALEQRIRGEHIQDYANLLYEEDSDKYKKQFSGVLKKQADPKEFVEIFNKTKEKIEKVV